jgi:hypothetical protein
LSWIKARIYKIACSVILNYYPDRASEKNVEFPFRGSCVYYPFFQILLILVDSRELIAPLIKIEVSFRGILPEMGRTKNGGYRGLMKLKSEVS